MFSFLLRFYIISVLVKISESILHKNPIFFNIFQSKRQGQLNGINVTINFLKNHLQYQERLPFGRC